MTKKHKREPRGLMDRYVAAVEAGEHPDPPMFSRPGDEASLDDFVDRIWEATRHWATSDSASDGARSDNKDVRKKRRRS